MMIRNIARSGALALATLCAGCGSFGDPAGYAVVTQDKFDFMPCKDIVVQRNGLAARDQQLTELITKAEASPGGYIAAAMAYRSELGSVRTQLTVANRAMQEKNCDPSGKT